MICDADLLLPSQKLLSRGSSRVHWRHTARASHCCTNFTRSGPAIFILDFTDSCTESLNCMKTYSNGYRETFAFVYILLFLWDGLSDKYLATQVNSNDAIGKMIV